MAKPTSVRYDVFVSYAEANRPWVIETLLPALTASGLRICQPELDFELGRPKLINIEEAIDSSRHTLVVLTPAWLESAGNEFESLLVQTTDPAGRQRKLIPLLLEPCTPPLRIAALTHADFTVPTEHQTQLKRLLHALGQRARIFISYKRNTECDEPLALHLQTTLETAGHHVYIDQKITVGVAWAQEINRQIKVTDYLVALLSADSLKSEIVAAEVTSSQRIVQLTLQFNIISQV